ncbi:hypothetical protein K504DRAFT_538915, partial [Pleomassaria siparia CBS 279.74]
MHSCVFLESCLLLIFTFFLLCIISCKIPHRVPPSPPPKRQHNGRDEKRQSGLEDRHHDICTHEDSDLGKAREEEETVSENAERRRIM